MKKRIEKVVELASQLNENARLTMGDKYLVNSESDKYYSVMDDDGDISPFHKINFKVVSEREVLEFEGDDLLKPYFYQRSTHMPIRVGYDLTDYNLKVIATPKDSPYEGKSREELIEIIKELKTNKR